MTHAYAPSAQRHEDHAVAEVDAVDHHHGALIGIPDAARR
jgi:hypothetical protein